VGGVLLHELDVFIYEKELPSPARRNNPKLFSLQGRKTIHLPLTRHVKDPVLQNAVSVATGTRNSLYYTFSQEVPICQLNHNKEAAVVVVKMREDAIYPASTMCRDLDIVANLVSKRLLGRSRLSSVYRPAQRSGW
jgi:hypothetical protein